MSRSVVKSKHDTPRSKQWSHSTRNLVAAALTLGTTALTALPAHSQSVPIKYEDIFIPCLNLTGKPYNDCVDDADRKWQANQKVSNTQSPTTPRGSCSLSDARLKFFQTTTLEPLQEIDKNLRAAVNGLSAKENASGWIPATSFGPQASKNSQNANRDSALAFLKRAQTEFSANVDLYATLSHDDCFKCVVMEKWAVLQGAANLIARTHKFAETGLWIGGDVSTVLHWTQSDPEGAGEPKADYNRRYISRVVKGISLNDMTDQWVAAVDPTFVEDVKKAICSLVNATKSNAYDRSPIYSAYALEVQKAVNTGFRRSLTTFKPADDAQKEAISGSTKPVKISELIASAEKSTASQCNPDANVVQFDLKPYDFPNYLVPKYCAKYKPAAD